MLKIRKKEDKDHKAIHNLVALVHSSEENAQLIDNLRHTNHYIPELSLVAESNGSIVGHLMIVKTHISDREVLLTTPISVISGPMRNDIAQQLLEEAVKICESLRFNIIFAISNSDIYQNVGFNIVRNNNIELPFKIPNQLFWVYEFADGNQNDFEGFIELPDFKE